MVEVYFTYNKEGHWETPCAVSPGTMVGSPKCHLCYSNEGHVIYKSSDGYYYVNCMASNKHISKKVQHIQEGEQAYLSLKNRKDNLEELKMVCLPVIEYLKKNYDPHTHIMITHTNAEVCMGYCSVFFDED